MDLANKKILTATESKQRLDIFLAAELGISRTSAQKMISGGLVTINQKEPKKAGARLHEGDKIDVIPRSPEGTTSESRGISESPSIGIATPRGTLGLAMTPKIISETPDYVVVEKPNGMLTHPTVAGETNTLANFIFKKYPELKDIGDDPKLRPGIVHRLDKDASGLLVIARTAEIFDKLKGQFKNRSVDKEYLALVHGKVESDTGEINFPIARSEQGDRMAAIPKEKNGIATENGKDALTEFEVMERFINFTLLKIKIHTGRMHQIRVHLLAYNHPVVGDKLYFQKKQKRTWDNKCGRLFLHSVKLAFTDLSGTRQAFESKLPEELNNFLKQIK